MSARTQQRGITILQVLVGIGAATLFMAGVINSAVNRQRQATLADMVTTAEAISGAAYAAAMAVTATDTATTPQWRFEYDFGNRTVAYEDIAGLNATLEFPFPEETVYGTRYEYIASSGLSGGRFIVPQEFAERLLFRGDQYIVNTLGTGDVQVTVQAPQDVTILRSRRNRTVKHHYFLEVTR